MALGLAALVLLAEPEAVEEAVAEGVAEEGAALATELALELPQTMVALQLACSLWDMAVFFRQSPRYRLQMKLSIVGW